MEKPRILVAEDDLGMQAFYRAVLENDFELTLVEDSNMALKMLASAGFDLFITDLNMPRWDGNTGVSGALAQNSNLPVIVASGYVGANEFDKVTDSFPNIVAKLKKPFLANSLIFAVNKALNRL